MHNREEIRAELEQIDPVMAQWPFHMPYSVPVGYFSNITDTILEQASTGLMVDRYRVYNVPTGYFDQLSERIIAAIRKQEVEEELEAFAPVLNTLSRAMPYAKPELPGLHMEAIMEQAAVSKIPVIQMPVRKNGKWMQYAVAAVAAGIIVVTGFLYTGNTGNTNNEITIASYTQMDVPQEISKLSEEELNTYLATTEKLVINTGDRDVYGIETLPEVDEHIEMTSDDELKQYLDESAETSAEAKADSK